VHIPVSFSLNGQPARVTVKPHHNLLDALRQQLGVTSCKKGCATGDCGACLVYLDGEMANACLVLAATVDGRDVRTVESLGGPGHLSVLQQTFVNYGAVQCGFCTPGLLLAAQNLLDRSPHPTRPEIERALLGNLCRCTGWIKVVEAIEGAAAGRVGPEPRLVPGSAAVPAAAGQRPALPAQLATKATPVPDERVDGVGARVPRRDGAQAVSGLTQFVDDIYLPGMLYLKARVSDHANARVVRLDTSRAKNLPGVVGVATWRDVPNNRFGFALQDRPVLADEYVRFLGQPLAAVAAVDEDTAAEAVSLIEVEYEPLAPVFDPMAAMQPGAPVIHEGGNVAKVGQYDHRRYRIGDVDQGFAEADFIFEDVVQTHVQSHAPLEPHACVATVDATGKLTVWAMMNAVYRAQRELAGILKLPLHRVRVISPAVGGHFGGKSSPHLEPIVALMALKTGRPCKWTWTREEEFAVSTARKPFLLRYRLGVKKDGTITAKQVTTIEDTGAYHTVETIKKHGIFTRGPYHIDNFAFDGYVAFTNKPPGGAFRGFGGAQPLLANELQMDRVAAALGMDPLEFRRRNALREGDIAPYGEPVEAVAALETMEAAAGARGWDTRQRPPRAGAKACGSGLGATTLNTGATGGAPASMAAVRVNEDGTAILYTGAIEAGCGSTTILAQMAAEELGIRLEDVAVVNGDTDSTPMDCGSSASQTTYITGNAVRQAAREARQILVEAAAAALEIDAADLEVRQGMIIPRGAPEKALTIRDATLRALRQGRFVLGRGGYRPLSTAISDDTGHGKVYETCQYAAVIADVEVDTETGEVRVLKLISAFDVGRAINPLLIEGQVQGGAAQEIGFALLENLYPRYPTPDLQARAFKDYPLVTAAEMPEVDTIIVEKPSAKGPWGAKGLGELVACANAGAILNAIHDAVGIRVTETPASPERVLRLLREKEREESSAST